MAGVNKVILVGNLGQDPEVKNNGNLVKFSLATSSKFTGKDGKQEKTEWHKIVVWGKLAEICEKYLKKGSQIYIEGRLETSKWQDKDNNNRYTTEVVASNMTMLGQRNQQQSNGSYNSAPTSGHDDFEDDDIPF